MNKLSLLFTCFLVTTLSARAGDGDYAVSKIDPALLKNANVIKGPRSSALRSGRIAKRYCIKNMPSPY
jgi:hypothetical protein